MYILDTDVCIQYMKNEKEVVERIRKEQELHISVVTLAELFYGIYNSKNINKHKKALFDFLAGVSVIEINFFIADSFGKLKSDLRRKGRLVGDFDILIAVCALVYDSILITRNVRHYQDADNLKIQSV